MIDALFALTLLCSTPVVDGPAQCEHDHDEQYEFEWVGRGLASVPSRTDTTVQIERGTTLVLQGTNGDIRVATWGKPMLRVQAEHRRGDKVSLQRKGRQLTITALSGPGLADEVEWNLTVPAWMPLQVSCMEGDVEVAGTQGALEVSALTGDVRVNGASGPMQLNSVEGQVYVLDTQGRVTASSINNDVHLMRVIGEIDAQSVNGSIRLEQLKALQVEASSVNGRVWFVGPFMPRGQYNLTSHNGELVLGLPEGQGAQVRVNTYQGDVRTELSELAEVLAPRLGHPRSFSFKMGEGGSDVDLESFSGLIQLLRLDDVQAKLRRLDERIQVRDVHRATELRRAADQRRSSVRAPRAPRPPRAVVSPRVAPTPAPLPDTLDHEEER